MKSTIRAIPITSALLPITLVSFVFILGQHEDQQEKPGHHQHEPQAEHAQHQETEPNRPSNVLMQQASGTSVNPASAPMEMIGARGGDWRFMFHGLAFVNHIQQTGPRGGDKFFSTNWLMGSAEHPVGNGSVMFRAMTSLEPATVTQREYPLLFQTGETAFGRPIVDGQHPHDLFMELSVQYVRMVGEDTVLNLYFGPVGDPALGPVAFPHRVSASEIPQAPLGHHLQDSTHIANEVITAAIKRGIFRFEVSGFHGREPEENRWNIDTGGIDSWSSRLTLTPSANWVGQVSVGRLNEPEALEEGDIVRSTASVTYNRPLSTGNWATGLIWGRNHKTEEQLNVNSYLLESVVRFKHKNYLTGRVELVDREELFANRPEIKEQLEETEGSVFRVAAYTLGYTRDVDLIPGITTGFGGNFTFHTVPSAIQPFYDGNTAGFVLFLRLRPQARGHAHP